MIEWSVYIWDKEETMVSTYLEIKSCIFALGGSKISALRLSNIKGFIQPEKYLQSFITKSPIGA